MNRLSFYHSFQFSKAEARCNSNVNKIGCSVRTNVTLRRILATIVAAAKQYILYTVCVCVCV